MLDLSQNGFFHLQAQGGDTTGGFDIFSNGLLDKDTFDYMLELKRMITAGDRTGLVGAMAYYAKVIAGFLCLAHFAGKAYNYMLGEETWKIMPLLRPFALLLVIMFWGGYCDLVRWPAAQLEGTAYAQIYAKNQEIGQLASERWEQIDILTGRIYTKAAMVDNAMDSWQNEDFLQALISSMSVTDCGRFLGVQGFPVGIHVDHREAGTDISSVLNRADHHDADALYEYTVYHRTALVRIFRARGMA